MFNETVINLAFPVDMSSKRKKSPPTEKKI